MNRLVLFDLDHTLLDGDSDVLWCDYLMDQGLLDRAGFGQRNAAMERDYRAGTVSAQAFSAFYVSTLRGRSAAQWQPWRAAFLREVVAPRIGAAARALVRRHVGDGALVVLTTATNRFITELTARELGLEHLIATECEMGAPGPALPAAPRGGSSEVAEPHSLEGADGHFTGRVLGTPNMREGKVERLHAWLAARGQGLGDFESWAYSDSANDLPLLGAVQHPVAVHPDPRLAAAAAQNGWPVMRLHGGG